jgi:DNA-directed RNA polymerase specialized sigma subunit
MADLMTSTYQVQVRRDPEDTRFWLADVEGLPGAHTSSRSLATLDGYVRQVIVLAAELPDEADETLVLEWHYHTGDAEVDIEAERLRLLRAQLDESSRDLNERTARLARRLVNEARLSVREAAAVLGVSPARIDQLVQRSKRRGGARPRPA